MSGTSQRTALGAVTPSQANVASGRQSMGPMRVSKPQKATGIPSRSSVGGASSGMASSSSGRPSMGRPSMGGDRRKSVMGRRSSMADGLITTMKDPRPLGDRQYMQLQIRALIQFLSENGYNYSITHKMLSSPSIKDFRQIFQFVYSFLDNNYTFDAKFKYEDDIPAIFKRIRYPFTINKSALFAVGSPHAWPTLLGALSWLVEVASFSMHVDIDAILYPTPEEEDDDNQMFFQFLQEAYSLFLDGCDDISHLEQNLRDSVEMSNAKIRSHTDRLEREVAAMQKEVTEARTMPSPLETLQEQRATLVSDQDKFDKFLVSVRDHKANHERKLSEHKQELETREQELSALESERSELLSVLEKQELSAQDVERITRDRTQLEESLRSVAMRKEGLDKTVWEREMNAAKSLEELEKTVNAYHKQAEKLNLLPLDAPNAQGTDFRLQLHLHAPRPDQILSVDLKGVVKPSLHKIRDRFNADLMTAQEQLAQAQEQLEQINDVATEKSDAVALLDAKLASLEAQHKEDKEAFSAKYKAQTRTLSDLETQLQRLRLSSDTGLNESERQVRKQQCEVDALSAQMASATQTANATMVQLVEMVTDHKSRVGERLKELLAHCAHNQSLLE